MVLTRFELRELQLLAFESNIATRAGSHLHRRCVTSGCPFGGLPRTACHVVLKAGLQSMECKSDIALSFLWVVGLDYAPSRMVEHGEPHG